jgi:hypothetical protein
MVPEKLASIAADPDVFLKEAKAAPGNPVELSIIVPVLNEAHALPELAGGLREELTKLGRTWEMIFVKKIGSGLFIFDATSVKRLR